MKCLDEKRRRLRHALGILGIGLSVLTLWNPVSSALGAEREMETFSATNFVFSLMDQTLTAESLTPETTEGEEVQDDFTFQFEGDLGPDGLQRFVSAGDAPLWFNEEVIDINEVSELRATDEWSVVGFTLDMPWRNATDELTNELMGNGWIMMETGSPGSYTGWKEEGTCRWIALSCTLVEGRTCVVLQIPYGL